MSLKHIGGLLSLWLLTAISMSAQIDPDHMYILGNVGDQGWDPSVGTEMQKVDDYSFEIVAHFNASSYFSFTSELAETSNDWDAIMPYRLASPSNNYEITESLYGQPIQLNDWGVNVNNAFLISKDGYYKIEIYTDELLVVFTPQSDPVVLITSISVSPTTATLEVGATRQLTATVLPSNATNKNVTWTSSNPTAATVSSNGLVTAKAAGSATITATTTDGSNLSASCAVTVKSPNVLITSISVRPTTATLNVGGTKQLTATIAPSNATNKTITWASSNTSVATVSSSGLVTAKAAGTATITAATTDGSNLSANCTVTVNPTLVTGITVSPTSATLEVGATKQLTATVSPSNATNKNVTWTSSNTAVATVSSSGVVTAKAAGSATITATTTDGTNLSAACAVTVKSPNVLITSISVRPTTATLNVGGTKQLTATIEPSNATNKTITWASSNPAVASVSSSGLVTANSVGTATIIVVTNDGSNLSATCVVTVNPILATSITVTPTTATLEVGATQQLTATVSPSNATNKNVTWTSSNPTTATVSSNGLVTAKAAGSATITATTTDGSNLNATCAITVKQSEKLKCDLNGDGQVNVMDVSYLIDVILDKIVL